MSSDFEYAKRKLVYKFLYLDTKQIENYKEAYLKPLDHISLDRESMIAENVDEKTKQALDDSLCTICLGIVKLPAVVCNDYEKHAICKDPCYEQLDNCDCPFRCEGGLNPDKNISQANQEIIRSRIYKCNEDQCDQHGKVFDQK